MILFFRKLRQRFLAQSQVTRYLAYALGEIVLVVLGILIALQIDNWNEGRKARERFLFGLKELYIQLQADTYGLRQARERFEFNREMIIRMEEQPESLDPVALPALILMLDNYTVFGHDYQQFLDYLEFNPADSVQNLIAKRLRGFLSTVAYISPRENQPAYGRDHLRKAGIPIRVFSNSDAAEGYLGEPWEGFYSEDDLAAARELIRSRTFLADLKSYRDFVRNFLNSFDATRQTLLSLLQDLETNYPELEFGIRNLEVIGTGTPLKNWDEGIPLERVPNRPGQWHLRTELRDGLVKFRSDPVWTLDWGYIPGQPGKAGFRGGDIPVSEGLFDIWFDLEAETYRIEPIHAD